MTILLLILEPQADLVSLGKVMEKRFQAFMFNAPLIPQATRSIKFPFTSCAKT